MKNNYLLKTCWSEPIKNVKKLIFAMLYFKKIKKTPRDFNYFTPVYQKSWYDLQLLRYSVWQTETSNYGSFFALLTLPPPLTTQKMKILKKMKKSWEDIIILQMCTNDQYHMRYSSWDKEWDIFLSFWGVFSLFPHYWPQKIKIWKKF